MKSEQLAEYLVTELMKMGDEPPERGGPCQRIQFMCGKYPQKEVPGGGMGKEALLDFFKWHLGGIEP